MHKKSLIRKTYTTYYSAIEVVAWIGYAATIAIVLIVFIDVCGRYFFNSPLRGGFELVEQTMVLSGGFAVVYSTLKKGHIIIDVIFDRLSKRAQIVMSYIFSFIGFAITMGMAWYVYLFGLRQLKPYPHVTTILKMNTSPFQFGLAIALTLGAMIFLMQIFTLWVEGYKNERDERSL